MGQGRSLKVSARKRNTCPYWRPQGRCKEITARGGHAARLLPRSQRTRSNLAGPEAGAGKRMCHLHPPCAAPDASPPPAFLRGALSRSGSRGRARPGAGEVAYGSPLGEEWGRSGRKQRPKSGGVGHGHQGDRALHGTRHSACEPRSEVMTFLPRLKVTGQLEGCPLPTERGRGLSLLMVHSTSSTSNLIRVRSVQPV